MATAAMSTAAIARPTTRRAAENRRVIVIFALPIERPKPTPSTAAIHLGALARLTCGKQKSLPSTAAIRLGALARCGRLWFQVERRPRPFVWTHTPTRGLLAARRARAGRSTAALRSPRARLSARPRRLARPARPASIGPLGSMPRGRGGLLASGMRRVYGRVGPARPRRLACQSSARRWWLCRSRAAAAACANGARPTAGIAIEDLAAAARAARAVSPYGRGDSLSSRA